MIRSDDRFAAWLAAGPETFSREGHDALGEALRRARPRPAWLASLAVATAHRPAAARSAPVLLVAVLALATTLVIAAGALRRATGPKDPASILFQSSVHGYEIRLPESTDVIAATRPLYPNEPWDGSWAAFTDRLGPLTLVLSLPSDGIVDLPGWAHDHFPMRAGATQCRTRPPGSTPIPTAPERWESVSYGGATGVRRLQCGYIDLVLEHGSRLYQITRRGGVARAARTDDVSALDAWLATLVLRPDLAQAPPQPTEFVSAIYGFRLTIPVAWSAVPATLDWDPIARRGAIDDRVVDRIHNPGIDRASGGRFRIFAADVPDGMSREAWFERYRPKRAFMRGGVTVGRECRWDRAGLVWIPVAWSFDPIETEIGGLRGWYRASCGVVDAAVFDGTRVYAVSYEGARAAGADLEAFWTLMRSFVPARAGFEIPRATG